MMRVWEFESAAIMSAVYEDYPTKVVKRPVHELDRVRMAVAKNGFSKGTSGTIVTDYGDGVGYEIEITSPRAGVFPVLRNEIEPLA